MDDIAYLNAEDLLDAFRSRTLSPVEVLDAIDARIDDVNPRVNAFSNRLRERARDAAREAEARYRGRGAGDPRPLEGLPTVLKEEQPIAGEPLRFASLMTDDTPSPISHPVVERVLGAGAVVLGRTTTPEFSCAGYTHSDLWGVTRNPWNPEFSPGGSSGGSAAALAAGFACLATGSDIAGSIRIPASFCGVVGFKPPYARVPLLPPLNLDPYCHAGSLARTVTDCALLQNVLAGQHWMDPITMPAPAPIRADATRVRGMRIAHAVTVGDYPVDEEVAASLAHAAAALADAGAIVEEVIVAVDRETARRAALTHFGALFGSLIAQGGLEDPRLTHYAREFSRRAIAAYEETGFYHGLELEVQVQHQVAAAMAGYDALICPTTGAIGLVAGDDYVDHDIDVAGVQVEYSDTMLTILFNIASRHPVLNMPIGIARNGVPIGVQVVGRAYDDATPFDVGRALEDRISFWADPNRRPLRS